MQLYFDLCTWCLIRRAASCFLGILKFIVLFLFPESRSLFIDFHIKGDLLRPINVFKVIILLNNLIALYMRNSINGRWKTLKWILCAWNGYYMHCSSIQKWEEISRKWWSLFRKGGVMGCNNLFLVVRRCLMLFVVLRFVVKLSFYWLLL